MADDRRRAPAEPKEISKISPENDIRVRVVGTILSKEEENITLDDGTSNVEVFFEEDVLDNLSEGDKIRVFGRVLPTPDGFELQGEIVQDFEEVDSELYDKVKKVVNTTE